MDRVTPRFPTRLLVGAARSSTRPGNLGRCPAHLQTCPAHRQVSAVPWGQGLQSRAARRQPGSAKVLDGTTVATTRSARVWGPDGVVKTAGFAAALIDASPPLGGDTR